MSANNQIFLIGRVGKEPESKVISSGKAFTTFSLAVRRPGKDKQGHELTDWFSVSTWGKQAELAAELIRKGALISVVGACNIDEWTDSNGNRQKMVKVSADNFQLLERREDSAPQAGQRQREMGRTGNHDIDPDEIPPF
jgi:single-strand DNA-binding protein